MIGIKKYFGGGGVNEERTDFIFIEAKQRATF